MATFHMNVRGSALSWQSYEEIDPETQEQVPTGRGHLSVALDLSSAEYKAIRAVFTEYEDEGRLVDAEAIVTAFQAAVAAQGEES